MRKDIKLGSDWKIVKKEKLKNVFVPENMIVVK